MPIDIDITEEWVVNRVRYYWASGIWHCLKQEAKETAKRYNVGRMGECLSDPVIISAVQAKEEIQDIVMDLIKEKDGFQSDTLHICRLAELCLFYLYSDFKQNNKEVSIYLFFFQE